MKCRPLAIRVDRSPARPRPFTVQCRPLSRSSGRPAVYPTEPPKTQLTKKAASKRAVYPNGLPQRSTRNQQGGERQRSKKNLPYAHEYRVLSTTHARKGEKFIFSITPSVDPMTDREQLDFQTSWSIPSKTVVIDGRIRHKPGQPAECYRLPADTTRCDECGGAVQHTTTFDGFTNRECCNCGKPFRCLRPDGTLGGGSLEPGPTEEIISGPKSQQEIF